MNVNMFWSRLGQIALVVALAFGFSVVQVACRGGMPPNNETTDSDGGTNTNNNGNHNTNENNNNNHNTNENNNTPDDGGSNTNNPDTKPPVDENKPPQKVTIQDVQNPQSPNHIGDGGGVILKGVIVTTPLFQVNDNLNGFFVADPSFPSTHGGVMVVVGNADLKSLKVGDVLDVEGAVDEYYGNTQINAQAARGGFVTPTGENKAGEIKAIEVKPEDIPAAPKSKEKPDESKAEPYEGMLVELKNVTVEKEADQYGAWMLKGGVLVEDTLFRYKPKAGDTIAMVRGVLQYTFDQYRLIPRSHNDVAGAKPECDAQNPCGTGRKCDDLNRCQWIACSADSDCNQGEVCKTDTQRCEKPLAKVTIKQIQDPNAQGHVGDGDPVSLEKVIVVTKTLEVSKNLKGFFVADPSNQGPYGGILVVISKTWSETIAIGDEISLKGQVQEYFHSTQISVNTDKGDTITKTGTNRKADIKPVEVKVTDLESKPADKNNPDASKTEPYEGVLIELKNVTVDTEPNKFGEWSLSGGFLVDDAFFKHTPTKGDSISVLRGVIYFSFGTYKLLPRSADDIQKSP